MTAFGRRTTGVNGIDVTVSPQMNSVLVNFLLIDAVTPIGS